MKKKNRGITLVALVVTMIVLLILAGVTIATVFGEEGIITKARVASMKTQFSQIKEEFDLFSAQEKTKTVGKYKQETLNASENNLVYNTKEGISGSIYEVIPVLEGSQYKGRFEVIKGELILNVKNKQEKEVAESLGIKVNPYVIIDGVLMSSDTNLLLMDETGTVVIPSTVTAIGEGAFTNLEGLKTIVIPGSVKEIRNNAFANNNTLEKVIIEEGVETIGNFTFAWCSRLKEIRCPESIYQIGIQAFYECRALEQFILPPKVERIKAHTFASCSQLKQVILPEGLKVIEAGAFSSCLNLNNLVIPKDVNVIVGTAFSNCKILSNVTVDPENTVYQYESGILMKKDGSEISFISDQIIKASDTFKIPQGIQNFSISLNQYTNLKKIEISKSVNYIYPDSFPITIEEVVVDSSNTTYKVENNCLCNKSGTKIYYCFSKEEIVRIPEGVKILDRYSFKAVTKAKQVLLPDSLTTIETFAFQYVSSNLQELKIGKNTNTINPLFKYRHYKGKVTIDPENPYYVIENNVLYSKDKKRLACPLYYVEGKFEIDPLVEVIETYAFHGHLSLTEVIIPNSVKEIGNSFQMCYGLAQIEIPSSVEKIGSGCFSNALNLKKIIVHKKEGSIAGAPWESLYGDRAVIWLGEN